LNAVEARLAANRVYMTDLYDDIAAAQSTYVGLALIEGATLRAVLWGAQHG
jgi:hypothetical protein